MDLTKIDIIVSEVDGIITDGVLALDNLNNVLFKNYCERDFEAINELKKVFTFVFLSTDPNISLGVMQKRSIPFFYVKSRDSKRKILTSNILPRYNMQPEDLLYIGSKLSDIECMNLAEASCYTISAPKGLFKVDNSEMINCSEGKGVLSDVLHLLTPEIDRRLRLM
jgi:3-deoxy-D-manno-octulosonate 8-phosphate phosphatase KdsC-like HAD superfamily phosphatase